MRYPNADFQHLPLRVHEILTEPRLLDVWAIPLAKGGAGRTLRDVLALIESNDPRAINPIVRGLFRLREVAGKLFGWDPPRPPHPPTRSYVHRLPDDILAASLDTVGMTQGPVRVLYRLENELLGEVINATAHAFISLSLSTRDDGYVAYLAVYVLDTHWWTRPYLALIEPFRRWIVYPALVKALQDRWREAYPA